MTKTVAYYLSLNSPWCYFGGHRLAAIAAETGAEVEVLPIQLGVVFAKTGGVPLPKRAPERQAYRLLELRRWRDHLGIPIVLQPAHFPADEALAAQAVIAAGVRGEDALSLATAIGGALWTDNRDIGERAVLATVAGTLGLDLDALLSEDLAPICRQRYAENTERALADKVFGVPAYVYRGELFWGQDRLDFLRRALSAK